MVDTIFFWLSKLIWMIVRPDFLLVAITLSGIILSFTGAKWASGILLSVSALSMVVITVLPVGQWLIAPLENRFPVNPQLPQKVDGIMVLGGAEAPFRSSIWQQPELTDAAERYIGFISLIRQYPEAVHLFSGGSGDPMNQSDTCSTVARMVFKDLGVDLSKILFEDGSRNTYENIKFSKKMAMPEPGQNWVLVTTSWHMPRAVGICEKLDWQVIPYPVDHSTELEKKWVFNLNFSGNLCLLTRAVKEWTGLAAYYLTGKTSAFFPPASS
ncbi:MAG: YdcF family protein [Desulfobacterales bacterium]|nr:YdcF family protein [Desulfobacterales bacterium]